jgi:hypothetical protein
MVHTYWLMSSTLLFNARLDIHQVRGNSEVRRETKGRNFEGREKKEEVLFNYMYKKLYQLCCLYYKATF